MTEEHTTPEDVARKNIEELKELIAGFSPKDRYLVWDLEWRAIAEYVDTLSDGVEGVEGVWWNGYMNGLSETLEGLGNSGVEPRLQRIEDRSSLSAYWEAVETELRAAFKAI